MSHVRPLVRSLALMLLLALFARTAAAQDSTAKSRFVIYGFAQLDMGKQIGQINPDWYDVLRPPSCRPRQRVRSRTARSS